MKQTYKLNTPILLPFQATQARSIRSDFPIRSREALRDLVARMID